MAESAFTVLDHIDGIKVPGNVFEEPVNEYWALIWLWQGLEFLNNQVSQLDKIARQRLNPEGNLQIQSLGNDPALADIPKTLLTSAFHWYATSACQYVRTVGAIARQQDESCPDPLRYVENVIPEVKTFRDKVSAHFAWATRNKNDTEAERMASIMPQLGFMNDSFVVGGFTLILNRGTEPSNLASIEPWSLSEVHGRLRERYWPD